MVMICPIFTQNMCHKFPISVDGQNMGKICPKYGPQIGPILPKTWHIKWEMFLNIYSVDIYVEKWRLFAEKTGYKENNRVCAMEQGTNTVYNTDNRCRKVTRNRYQYCIKYCAKDWHRRRVQRGVNALWSTNL